MVRVAHERLLRIRDAARLVGVSVDTLRYYERIGLLPVPHRTPGGYRVYGEYELRRLQFIRRAKTLNFTLGEIRYLLQLAAAGDCQPVRQEVTKLLHREIGECRTKLKELLALQDKLEEFYSLAQEHGSEENCTCQDFPEDCACLPWYEQDQREAPCLLLP